jgi:SH3-like domain-containing protein
MPDLRRRGLRDRGAVTRSLPALLLAAMLLPPPAAAAQNQTLPRFESLRSDRVNLRVGPGENYPIAWVLVRKDMPVEIVREFSHWRMIRDWQGTEGWVHERMMSPRRRVVVTGGVHILRRLPDPASPAVARAEPGVIGNLVECRGAWCRITAGDVSGWIERRDVWGVLPDEQVQ